MHKDNERLLQAIRVGNIGIFEHDHEADTIFWSPELRRMYGWDPSETASLQKILGHAHPDDAARVAAAVQRAHDPRGDGAFDIEHRIIDTQGAVRWLLTRSKTYFGEGAGRERPLRTIGAVQDVTERHEAEDRLRVLDTVLSSSARAVAIADAQGRLTFANAALTRLWGYEREVTLVGRSIFELWHPEEGAEAALERLKVDGTQVLETRAIRRDGTPFFLELTAEAVCDARGYLTQVLVTFADITLRKKLEDQVSRAQKMESIGRLAGGVAHDFNNLLTVILGCLELSSAGLPAYDPARASLHDATAAARTAAALTRQLLALSRKETIAPRAIDLNEVVHRMHTTILRLLRENTRLEIICGPNVPPIWFDPVQLEQVILNLAVNGRDAMTGGGRLTIETSLVEASEREGTHAAERRALLQVSDTGVGITDEVRARLFEPFFTTKEAGKGTGLGLAVVYGAVEQNGGDIEVESQIGHGSTFKIYLPLSRSAAPSV